MKVGQPSNEDGNTPKKQSYGVFGDVFLCSIVIVLVIVGCGGWAATSEIAGAVVSQGSVVVEQYVKKVQHREGGIIAEIKVRNGDRVKAGQTLIRLDGTTTRAELGVLRSQLTELQGRLARLKAERDLAKAVVFPKGFGNRPEASVIIAGELKLFNNKREERESQKAQYRLRVQQLENEKRGIEAQLEAKKLELKLFRQELAGVNKLLLKNLVPATRGFALKREEARIAGELGNLIAQGARVGGQISEIKLQIINVDITLRSEAQSELRTVEARISELLEKVVAAEDRLNRTTIAAPQGGIVHELRFHTIGGVVTPAEPLLLIVPEGEALSIELKIPPINIEQVYLDQDVRLRFTAFNQRTTPEVNGKISFISADISQDPKSKADYFAARVQLGNPSNWKINGKNVVPGMPVEAYITTEKRTALSYLTRPFVDQFQRAFREQ